MKSSNAYAKVYIGLKDGLFRRYPYADLTSYNTLVYTCAQTGLQTTGYDPRCRTWYFLAQNTYIPQYTNPYIDAFSGRMHISMSKAVYDKTDGTLIGVVSADFSMEEIDKITEDSNRFIRNSYNFVIDNTGLVISYPDLDRNIVNPSILSMENSVNYATWNNILTHATGNVSSITFMKNNEQTNTSHVKISSKYILCVMYPTSSLSYDADKMSSKFTKFINDGIIGIAIVFALLLACTIISVRKFAMKHTQSLKQFSDFLSDTSRANRDIKMANMAPVSAEINIFKDNLRNLSSAIDAGNEAYLQGDLDKALAKYDIGLQLFTARKNIRGLAVCTNNKANVLKRMGKNQEAIDMYHQSIKHVNAISGANKDDVACKIMTANRFMNIGVVFDDINNFIDAENFYNQSIQLHKETDNVIGLVRVKNNVGLMLLKQGRIIAADSYINETYTMIKDKHDLISLQYTAKIKGILEFTKGNYEMTKGNVVAANVYYKTATDWFTYVLRNFQETDVYIQQTCINYLEKTYIASGQQDLLNEFKKTYSFKGLDNNSGLSLASSQLKHIKFVLDCSGSMSGSFIEQCRKSIIDIVGQYINNADNVTLITFNESCKVLFSSLVKQNYLDYITSSVNNHENTKTTGGTAFYDAMNYAITVKLASNSVSNPIVKSDAKFDDWVIALTDGEDNRSTVNPGQLEKIINMTNTNLVIITVGQLKNSAHIANFCKQSKLCKRIHINADTNPNGIAQAFSKAARFMVGQLYVDNL
jgi:tetratricopeptide (TPR) repeat protein